MSSRICSKCNREKKISEYSWRRKEKGWRHSFCKACHSAYRRVHYLGNRKKYISKAKKWNDKQTIILRKFIIKYLSEHPCVDCGVVDIRVLDFDHENNKFMGISQMVRSCYSTKSIENEISKCKVRCANCHRIKTFVDGNYWKEKMGL